MISYHDVPLGQMPVWVKNNFLKHIDVAIIEAAAIDENGNIIPTTSVGTSNIYAEYADKIIIEVNTYPAVLRESTMFILRSALRIHSPFR